MKKIFSVIFLAAFLSTTLINHVFAASASYKITFTLPAIIGLNVPPYEIDTLDAKNSKGLSETITEEIWRENKRIVLKTTVVK